MKMAIIGLGNPIVGDDAIGIEVVEYIKEEYSLPPSVDILVDVSLSGIGLVEIFRGYDKVIIVDSMQTDEYNKGEVAILHPDQFLSAMHVSDYHNMDFFTAYDFCKQTYDDIPANEDITILGIEINFVKEFSDQLTPQIQDKFDEIVNFVYEEIKNVIREEKIPNVI